MAGGGGTRLWPLSRGQHPKPFLPLLEGGRSLLAETVSRLAPLVEIDDVYVVTDARYEEMVRAVAPDIPPSNIVGEPMGRNTAAAVALAAHGITRASDEIMVVLPADQAILDAAAFRAALHAAAMRAVDGDLVTLGVAATAPETGYGYVIASGGAEQHAGHDTYRVERFEEKPSATRAVELIAGAAASWNAGIFVWRRDSVLDGLDRYSPDISKPIAEWVSAHGRDVAAPGVAWPGDSMDETYAALRATSIDYALLEPASADGRVAVVPMSVGWSDLGSWSALRDHRRDVEGSTVVSAEPPARVIEVDGRDVLVHASGGRVVAVVGLDDVIVVDTPDALLVTSADAAQDVRKVVDRLREEGLDELL